MGLVFGRTCRSCTSTSSTAAAPNPNPGRFRIVATVQIGAHLVAKIHYLDCTNFEGNKICVYKDTTAEQFLNASVLDPHFSERGWSPIARFKPTNEGMELAKKFAAMI